jgi:signal transduction histidine kinase
MLSRLMNWRFWMVIIAIAIVAYSIVFSNRLAKTIADEEYKRIKNYAAAIESASKASLQQDISFQLDIMTSNNTIPVILTDSKNTIIDHRNVNAKGDSNAADKISTKELQEKIVEFKKLHTPIVIESQPSQFVYYGESVVLHQLRYFPYILFAVIAVFLSVVFIAYNNANRSMQNRLWVGMSKETAHQLGTPLMSLMGWLEILKGNGQEAVADEMEKDVSRLQLIADRFGKIGSTPQLTLNDVQHHIQNMVSYMKRRSAKNISMEVKSNSDQPVMVMMNGPLFDWVIENLIRNSLDAMESNGTILIDIRNEPTRVTIDFTDTGKGMTKNQYQKVFKPGYTTKQRGWGLGLSLAKRIITKYHHGEIFVAKSELGVGTTFRIILRR